MLAVGVALTFGLTLGYWISRQATDRRGQAVPVRTSSMIGPATEVPRTTIETRVPILTVATVEGSFEGRVVDVGLSLTRSEGDASPFQLAFLEETPGGQGPQLRSSIWMAAMVAAILRETDLSGYRLTVTVPGAVDGPSAGAALCLAFVGLLDGKTFPSDIALTGTILPDGSLGQVGGIGAKIRACRRRGVGRVIVPDNVRFELPSDGNGPLDLKALAVREGIAFLPAATLHDAAEIVFGTTSASLAPETNMASVIPDDIDARLSSQAVQLLKESIRLWGEHEAQQDELQKLAVYRAIVDELARDASESLQSGQILHGWTATRELHALMTARQRHRSFMSSLTLQGDGLLPHLDKEIAQRLQGLDDSAGIVHAWAERSNRSALGTQFLVDVTEISATRFWMNRYDAAVQQKPAKDGERPTPAGPEVSPRTSRELKLLLVESAQVSQEVKGHDLAELSRLLPPTSFVPGRPERIERLFYSVMTVVDQAILDLVVVPIAGQSGMAPQDVLQRMIGQDQLILEYIASKEVADQIHQRLFATTGNPGPNDVLAAANAQLCAGQIALASAILVRWSELAPAVNADEAPRYGRTFVLTRLLRSARENAVRHLSECQSRHVPCLKAVERFQKAEMMRDNRDDDPVNALACYWTAALQAQALRLLMTPPERVASRP
jgi:hypothetical protein